MVSPHLDDGLSAFLSVRPRLVSIARRMLPSIVNRSTGRISTNFRTIAAVTGTRTKPARSSMANTASTVRIVRAVLPRRGALSGSDIGYVERCNALKQAQGRCAKAPETVMLVRISVGMPVTRLTESPREISPRGAHRSVQIESLAAATTSRMLLAKPR